MNDIGKKRNSSKSIIKRRKYLKQEKKNLKNSELQSNVGRSI